MEYLRQNNKKVSNIAFTEDNIDAKGKKCWLLVVEILVQIVLELPIDKGATEVHQIEIIPTPPSQRDETMPW